MTRMVLEVEGRDSVDLGVVTDYSDSYSFNVSAIKMPTLPAENTFLIDTGSTEALSISFSRRNPESGVSNASWLRSIIALVNRWQAETNGCILHIIPDVGEQIEQATEDLNVYIASFTHTYSKGTPDLISCSMKLKVGSLYGTYDSGPSIASDAMQVLISNSTGTQWYYLMNSEYNCIEEYTIYGGVNQPFEYIEMSIPRRRLQSFASVLITNNDIIAGKNQLIVNAIGKGNFVITRCKLNNDIYTLTGYSYAEAFRGTVTKRVYSNAYTPYQIIEDILRTGVQLENLSVIYTGEQFVSRCDTTVSWDGEVSFAEGSNAWYVMQICALRLGCKLFFHEDTAYLIDMKETANLNYGGELDLYPVGADVEDFGYNVVGSPELGDEGTSQLCTIVSIQYTDANSGTTSVNATCNETSFAYYGERGQKTIRIPEIGNESDAMAIGSNYCEYLCESQTSIGFSVRERSSDGWHCALDIDRTPERITNNMDEVEITCQPKSSSTSSPFPQMLLQSTFARTYPQGVTEYWYGILQQNDLTQTVSTILTAIENN